MATNPVLVGRPEPGSTPAQSAAGPKPHILVVEDHEDSREMLRALLELEGYDVEVTPDGRSGVDAAFARPPLVALFDIGLPEIDGYGVARALRERLGQAVWLVALTSWTTPADRRKSADAGFDLHVAKPVAADRLKGLLRDIVHERRG
jgi:CheY-like chemotaxis protein